MKQRTGEACRLAFGTIQNKANQNTTRLAGSGKYRRPGIMVLINEVDWELEGEEECELVDGDEVLFVSTLHGG